MLERYELKVLNFKSKKDILPYVEEMRQQGITSLYGIAKQLNELGVKTFAGGKWYPTTVKNTLGYLAG